MTWLIDRVILKSRDIVIPETLQRQALEQLRVNHIGIKKLNSWHANQSIGQV